MSDASYKLIYPNRDLIVPIDINHILQKRLDVSLTFTDFEWYKQWPTDWENKDGTAQTSIGRMRTLPSSEEG